MSSNIHVITSIFFLHTYIIMYADFYKYISWMLKFARKCIRKIFKNLKSFRQFYVINTFYESEILVEIKF